MITVKFSWLVNALRENFSLDPATGKPVAAPSEKFSLPATQNTIFSLTAGASNIFLHRADKCRKKFAERNSMRKNLLDAFQSKTREDAFSLFSWNLAKSKGRTGKISS